MAHMMLTVNMKAGVALRLIPVRLPGDGGEDSCVQA